jgi:hypothetical protein
MDTLQQFIDIAVCISKNEALQKEARTRHLIYLAQVRGSR